MRLFGFLFPFSFKKYNLASYTALIFYIALSLVGALGLGILFLGLGSFWRYISIPFWGLFLYDFLAMLFTTLSFFGVVKVKRKPKKMKQSQPPEPPAQPATPVVNLQIKTENN